METSVLCLWLPTLTDAILGDPPPPHNDVMLEIPGGPADISRLAFGDHIDETGANSQRLQANSGVAVVAWQPTGA